MSEILKSKSLLVNYVMGVIKVSKYIYTYTALMPMDENITRVTFSFWTMNLFGKMHLATMIGRWGIFRILCTLLGYGTLSTTSDIQKLV